MDFLSIVVRLLISRMKEPDDTDDVLDLIGTALEGSFGSVAKCPGAVFIDHNGKTYSISVTECEQCE